MGHFIDRTGHTYGYLRVLGRGFHDKTLTVQWLCLCTCGTKKVVASSALQAGKVKSCGCMQTANRLKDISGQRFGRLTVVDFVDFAPNRVSRWLCRCDCGNTKVIRKSNLVGKNPKTNTRSCGCQKIDAQKKRLTTHGETKHGATQSKEYNCWRNIIQRCYNPRNKRYNSYGAKGVVCCDKWRNDFAAFLKDVGRSPDGKPCIDRINPFGNYEPSNVRWVDVKTSNHNKRSNYNGE